MHVSDLVNIRRQILEYLNPEDPLAEPITLSPDDFYSSLDAELYLWWVSLDVIVKI